MSQPDRECIANLGDASPLDYGGLFVFRDKTGVHTEEAELLITPEDGERGKYVVYRFVLDRCTFTNGVLSDNKFHPDHCAWWATTPERMRERPQDGKGLTDIANFTGISESELVSMFCSEDALERAQAYRFVGDYHGYENLDSYPLELTRKEARQRYAKVKMV